MKRILSKPNVWIELLVNRQNTDWDSKTDDEKFYLSPIAQQYITDKSKQQLEPRVLRLVLITLGDWFNENPTCQQVRHVRNSQGLFTVDPRISYPLRRVVTNQEPNAQHLFIGHSIGVKDPNEGLPRMLALTNFGQMGINLIVREENRWSLNDQIIFSLP